MKMKMKMTSTSPMRMRATTTDNLPIPKQRICLSPILPLPSKPIPIAGNSLHSRDFPSPSPIEPAFPAREEAG
jgi:hypothetical protein